MAVTFPRDGPIAFWGVPGFSIKGEDKEAFPNFGLTQDPDKSGLWGSLSGHVMCSELGHTLLRKRQLCDSGECHRGQRGQLTAPGKN